MRETCGVQSVIECLVFNARSLKSIEKRTELANLLSLEKYYVIAVTETWLNETITDSMLLSCPGSFVRFPYSVFRCDRGGRDGGGACVFVHNSVIATSVPLPDEFSDLEVIAVDLKSQNQSDLRFVSVYRPPNQTPEHARMLASCLSHLCNIVTPVSVVGDFNIPSVNWKSLSCNQDGISDTLLDCFLMNNMYQYVMEPTRGRNILDLVLSNTVDSVLNIEVLGETFLNSDHHLIRFSVSFVRFNRRSAFSCLAVCVLVMLRCK